MRIRKGVWVLCIALLALVGSHANAQSVCGNLPADQCRSKDVVIIAPGANPANVDLWRKHQKEVGAYGKTWIGPYTSDSRIKFEGKTRDTIIHVPIGFDNTRTPDVVIWLHGHHGHNKFNVRLLRHIKALQSRGVNGPIIVTVEQPWTANGYTPTSRNGTGPFRKDGEFETWADSIVFPMLRFLGVNPESLRSSHITLVGHSAGGSGILAMSKSDALTVLRPGRIIFSDSTYGSWFRGFYDNYYKDNPQAEVVVLARRGGPTHDSMRYFFRDRPEARKLSNLKYIVLDRNTWSHKRIGDNCLLYPGAPFPP